MRYLRDILRRVRQSRLWRALHPARPSSASVHALLVAASRPMFREVTPHGVRVYSLCGTCGVPLSTSATLCDACARTRSLPSG